MNEGKANLAEKLAALNARFATGLDGKLTEIERAAEGLQAGAPPDAARHALQTVGGLAHKLAGSAGTFGYPALGDAALRLEMLCEPVNRGQPGVSPTQHDDIVKAVAALRTEAAAKI